MDTNTKDEFFPLTFSADGHKNAYHLDKCDFVQHRPPYAACLFKLKEHEAKRLGAACACVSGIAKGECAAQVMRAEELAAGRAIYYSDRARQHVSIQDREERTVIKLSGTAPVKWPAKSVITPTVPKPTNETDSTGDYAAAINRAMQEQPVAAPAVAPPQPVVHASPVVKAGMSMVEIARAAMARASV